MIFFAIKFTRSAGTKIEEGVKNPELNKQGTGVQVDIVPHNKSVIDKSQNEEEINDLLNASQQSQIVKKKPLNQSASQEEEIDLLAQKTKTNEQIEQNPIAKDLNEKKEKVDPKKKQEVGQDKKEKDLSNTIVVENQKKNEEKEIKKAKLFKRSESFAIKKENGNSCNKDLLLAFGIVLDKNRENAEIVPEPSSTKTKTLCRRNIGTCCTFNEMMSVADNFAIAANKFRQQFEILEEIFIMFKGNKINEVLYDLRDHKKCRKILDEHPLIPKDSEGKFVGTFENQILPKIQEKVEGLFNEKRRYKKHIISTYGNLVCSICSPSEQNYFKYHEDTGITDLEVNFSNCQEFLDLKDFEIRVIEAYQEFILPLTRIFDCEDKEENPKIDALEIDEAVENKELFNDCYQNFAIENPKCLQICKKFDLSTYKFPGNFFKVSKQILSLFSMKFLNMDAADFYQIRKKKDFENFAAAETFNFFPGRDKNAKIDISKTDIKYVQAKGINITNDYINRIFLEHNQYKFATLNKILTLITLVLIF